MAELGVFDDDLLRKITPGASLKVTGRLVASLGKGQAIEIKASMIEVLGECNPDTYPLQLKNRPSLEYLREIAHLRFLTQTFGAIFRVRHALAFPFAIHQFFHEKGFFYLHTPIITASDAEGAGEMFRVSTLPFDGTLRKEDGSVDFTEDFFGRATNLTVSGQLEGELGAMAFSDIYTFGPTFRAENSNTARHLAEFWMIEPEMAFYDIEDNMNLAESFIRYLIRYVMDNNRDDLDFLAQRLAEEEKQKPQAERSELGLIEKLEFVAGNQFRADHLYGSHRDPFTIAGLQKEKFQYDVKWGIDLQSEHERYLVEKHFSKPVIVTGYPTGIKAFYMRQNDDGKDGRGAWTSSYPASGSWSGARSAQEDSTSWRSGMREMHVPVDEMWWYLDTRRFGTVPHAGFGLGFERMMLFVTGMTNIRDVIAFPPGRQRAQNFRSPRSSKKVLPSSSIFFITNPNPWLFQSLTSPNSPALPVKKQLLSPSWETHTKKSVSSP